MKSLLIISVSVLPYLVLADPAAKPEPKENKIEQGILPLVAAGVAGLGLLSAAGATLGSLGGSAQSQNDCRCTGSGPSCRGTSVG